MAIICSCRIITTDDVKLAATTCLRGVSDDMCPKKATKRMLVEAKGKPNACCGGSCTPSINREIETTFEMHAGEVDLVRA